jgi:hypothetical protein
MDTDKKRSESCVPICVYLCLSVVKNNPDYSRLST